MLKIYNKQNGLCYFSGKPMVFGWVNGKINSDTLSLDKLDPSKGYIKGNVVWCSYLINTMKQNMTEEQFYTFIEGILKFKKKL